MSSSDKPLPASSILTLSSLTKVLTLACDDVLRELANVPSEHWNESVFRFFIVRQLLKIPDIDCRSEWNRVDLVIQSPRGATLLELKFFTSQPLRDQAGKTIRMKGRPSPKNYGEYENALKKLRSAREAKWIRFCDGVASAHLLLAYIDPVMTNKPTYGSHYDSIAAGDGFASVHTILERVPVAIESCLTCKLITVQAEDAV